MKHEVARRDPSHEQRLAWNTAHGSDTIRMVAHMGGHEWLRWRADLVNALSQLPDGRTFAFGDAASDSSYFHHRSLEERQAAQEAVGVAARKAHDELSARYAELSRHRRKHPLGRGKETPSRSRVTPAAKRQDMLLDQGLTETFPASDPVSVSRVS